MDGERKAKLQKHHQKNKGKKAVMMTQSNKHTRFCENARLEILDS